MDVVRIIKRYQIKINSLSVELNVTLRIENVMTSLLCRVRPNPEPTSGAFFVFVCLFGRFFFLVICIYLPFLGYFQSKF